MAAALTNAEVALLAYLPPAAEAPVEIHDQHRAGVERLVAAGFAEAVPHPEPQPRYARLRARRTAAGHLLLAEWRRRPVALSEDVLTPRQRQALDLVRESVRLRRVAPSLRELAAGLGLARHSAAHRLVAELVDRGFLRRVPGRMRNVVPVEFGRDAEAA